MLLEIPRSPDSPEGQLRCPRATRPRTAEGPVSRATMRAGYGLLFSVPAAGLDVLRSAFPRHDLIHARHPLSRSPRSCFDASGLGVIGLCSPSSVRGRTARRLPDAWIDLAQEPKLVGQRQEASVSLLSVRLGREPPGAVRSGDAPEPVCRGGGPVPARRLRCPVDQRPRSGRPHQGNGCKSRSAGNSDWPGPNPRKWPSFKPRSTCNRPPSHCRRACTSSAFSSLRLAWSHCSNWSSTSSTFRPGSR